MHQLGRFYNHQDDSANHNEALKKNSQALKNNAQALKKNAHHIRDRDRINKTNKTFFKKNQFYFVFFNDNKCHLYENLKT